MCGYCLEYYHPISAWITFHLFVIDDVRIAASHVPLAGRRRRSPRLGVLGRLFGFGRAGLGLRVLALSAAVARGQRQPADARAVRCLARAVRLARRANVARYTAATTTTGERVRLRHRRAAVGAAHHSHR